MDELAAIAKRQKDQESRSRISIGDKVRIYFEHCEMICGYVRSCATQTGECWVIEDIGGYELHYVQSFARMSKDIS